MINNIKRIIVLDSGILSHKSIFNWGIMQRLKNEGKLQSNWIPNSDYTYFNMMLSLLQKISVKKDDLIIVACDARNSWRRAFYLQYKMQRKEQRDKFEEIDWGFHYNAIEEMNRKLNQSTNWHFIKISDFINQQEILETREAQSLDIFNGIESNILYGIESDDIQATIAKNFPDKEIILVTGDVDMEMLAFFPNVKIFSTNLKYKSSKGMYKVIDNPLIVLANKIKKGDISDNILVDKKHDTEQDIAIRQLIIDLINLPQFVEEPILNVINNLKEKEIKYDLLPFQNSLAKKFDKIYSNEKEITYDESQTLLNKRAIRKSNKKNKVKKEKNLKKELEKQENFR